MHKKLASLILSGLISVSVVGCGNNEVEYQEPQVQQEETYQEPQVQDEDKLNKEEQEKSLIRLSILSDLVYYKNVADKMVNITNSLVDINDCITAYSETETILEDVKAYENCDETTDLKSYLVNMLISTIECIDYVYQNDIYKGEKALNDMETYRLKYEQELERLTEEYS